MKRVAVVILNWNGKALLERFLPALLSGTDADLADCIVADNASTDGSLAFLQERYPHIPLIPLERNYGFAEGYNRAFAALKQDYEYVVLLNSDVEVTDNWLYPLVSYLDAHPEVVAAQPKILSFHRKQYFEYAGAAGGYLDAYAYPFCRGRILQTIEEDRHQYDDIRPVLWAGGACLFIRLQTYREAGGLDAGFFAHQEEIDLCWRLNAQGKQIVCIPQSVVYHVGGATLAMETPRKTFLNFRNNLLMIYKNTPEKRLRKVLFVRWFADRFAALTFLLKGYPANANAVFRAWNAFHKLKRSYLPVRKAIREKALPEETPLIYKGCIVRDYHLRGKKTYAGLV
ncbi:MAG: glycosyltransferase family 2 protein [Dysgonamonadaceae bacterium]|jgi:GT2 family glycosyltransferase|nr:glycosyltransferase family 2 protein [Dysgonamonadaceae bacterium]